MTLLETPARIHEQAEQINTHKKMIDRIRNLFYTACMLHSLLKYLKSLWPKIPQKMRHRMVLPLFNLLAYRVQPVKISQLDHFIVAGFFSTTSGFGRSAQLLVEALEHQGKKVERLDISHYFLPEFEAPTTQPILDLPAEIPLIVHCNALYLPYLYLRLKRPFLKNRFIIGYWAWETDQLPKTWRAGFSRVHRVWAATTFCQTIFQSYLSTPVGLVPHPICLQPQSFKTRTDFNLPNHAFVVLVMFSVKSGFARKNPLGAIQAFLAAFSNRSDVLLALKISDLDAYPEGVAELLHIIAPHSNIKLITDRYTREDIFSLINTCDVLLSLHRSEGFGLVLAEAMALGKPVVATGFSGNLDFMTPENSCLVSYKLIPVEDHQLGMSASEGTWAEPDISEASLHLQKLQAAPEYRNKLGLLAQKTIQETLSLPQIGILLEQELDNLINKS